MGEDVTPFGRDEFEIPGSHSWIAGGLTDLGTGNPSPGQSTRPPGLNPRVAE